MNSAMTDDKDMYSPTITATPSMEYVAMPPPILGLPDEKTILRELDDNDEEEYPEGGRGWLVVAGCFIQAMATIGMPSDRVILMTVLHLIPFRRPTTSLGCISRILQRARLP